MLMASSTACKNPESNHFFSFLERQEQYPVWFSSYVPATPWSSKAAAITSCAIIWQPTAAVSRDDTISMGQLHWWRWAQSYESTPFCSGLCMSLQPYALLIILVVGLNVKSFTIIVCNYNLMQKSSGNSHNSSRICLLSKQRNWKVI